MKQITRRWLHGLAAAAINGMSTTVTMMIVDPHTFNLQEWRKVASVAVTAAIVGAFLYLKQAPLPPIGTAPPRPRRSRPGTIGMVLLALGLGMTAIGCAGAAKANRTATVAVVSAEAQMHQALGQARLRINQACDPGVLVETCRGIRMAFAGVLDGAASFARAILSEQWSAFVSLVDDINLAIQEVRKLPPGALRDALVADFQRAVPAFNTGGQR